MQYFSAPRVQYRCFWSVVNFKNFWRFLNSCHPAISLLRQPFHDKPLKSLLSYLSFFLAIHLFQVTPSLTQPPFCLTYSHLSLSLFHPPLSHPAISHVATNLSHQPPNSCTQPSIYLTLPCTHLSHLATQLYTQPPIFSISLSHTSVSLCHALIYLTQHLYHFSQLSHIATHLSHFAMHPSTSLSHQLLHLAMHPSISLSHPTLALSHPFLQLSHPLISFSHPSVKYNLYKISGTSTFNTSANLSCIFQ